MFEIPNEYIEELVSRELIDPDDPERTIIDQLADAEMRISGELSDAEMHLLMNTEEQD